MIDIEQIERTKTIDEILKLYPVTRDFFFNYNLESIPGDRTLSAALAETDETQLSEFGVSRTDVIDQFTLFLKTILDAPAAHQKAGSITILGGCNKLGREENINLTIKAGEIISIVGPTGSGKSRLLSDIECLAQRDTPTGRQVLIDGRALSDSERFNIEGKMVAQLSQNMNFVMDLSVAEFLDMHAKSRLCVNPEQVIRQCFECANSLAGEKFTPETKVTQLSGGQSRALMIADTACLSVSPIVLIDEIENAGIDRKQALEILADNEKIVLISTHDPLLALTAGKRIIMQNGGISRIIESPAAEKESLRLIESIDGILQQIRSRLRQGEIINLPNEVRETWEKRISGNYTIT
jgi:ABC-type lipoprotein export system ATPase subunit